MHGEKLHTVSTETYLDFNAIHHTEDTTEAIVFTAITRFSTARPY